MEEPSRNSMEASIILLLFIQPSFKHQHIPQTIVPAPLAAHMLRIGAVGLQQGLQKGLKGQVLFFATIMIRLLTEVT